MKKNTYYAIYDKSDELIGCWINEDGSINTNWIFKKVTEKQFNKIWKN